MAILRGEVYFVELGPTRGRELDDKRRPVIIVSSNEINRKPLVVVVVPGTSWREGRRVFDTEVKIDSTPENGLTGPTIFQGSQVKALDHSRFDQDPVGEVSPADLAAIEECLRLCLVL